MTAEDDDQHEEITERRQRLAQLSLRHMSDLQAHLEELPALDRARAAVTLMDDLRSQLDLVSQARIEAVHELRLRGLSVSSIAVELGVTRQKVHQLLQGEESQARVTTELRRTTRPATTTEVYGDRLDDFGRTLEAEFRLFGQPIIPLDGRDANAVELLVRWESPNHELLGPTDFLPALEAEGLTDRLTEWMLRKAGRLRGRSAPLLNSTKIHLNVDITSVPLLAILGDVAEEVALDPETLILEVAESQPLSSAAMEGASDLVARGFGLVLDDFGTGYSSLTMLRRMPLTGLKIDRSFILRLDETDSRAVIDASLALATSLGLETYAEGIETRRQAEYLAGMGCRYGEGYYFGKPQPL